MNSKSKKPSKKFFITKVSNFFKDLDITWKNLGVIGGVFAAGFIAGTYYKETMLIKSENAKERQHLIELSGMIEMWQEKEHKYHEEIEQLHHDYHIIEIKLESYEQKRKK